VRPIGSISVLAIVGGLALAASASASTLAVDSGGTLRFDAARGEANNVDLRDGGGQTTVTDSGSIIQAGNGCTQVTPHQASCPLPGGFGDQNVVMTLADRNDAARAFKVSFGHIAIDGGAGNDTISDAPQSGADVDGGLGDDTITVHPNFGGSVDVHGGLGRDSITAASASGTVDGGLGDDRISTGPLALVAQLTGGFGDDRIVSQNGTSTINGGFGRDFIDGHDEGDTIDCGSGLDRYVQYAGDTVSNCEVPQA
jgi:Ca2+-binding RTX toxin-like protein